MLTPVQKQLVRDSWMKVLPHAEATSSTFYAHLFEIAPEVRPLFSGNMAAQGAKLMQMLSFAVASLDNVQVLFQPLRELGARHVEYGVKPEHYGAVAAALLHTLEVRLGEEFSDELRDAWVAVYDELSAIMLARAG